MTELSDYSGEFNPEAKYEDFSKEAQASLLTEYARLEKALAGWWYDTVKERHGEQEVFECAREVADRGIPYRQQRVMKALNIQGNDIATCFKAIQMDQGASPDMYDNEWEFKNPNHGILTLNLCPTLEFYERHGGVVTMENVCNVCSVSFPKIAKFFNPDMKVKTLKLPPRMSEDEICCQWELKIEE
ncbi:DUF6125 family protein [Chloroflexota bacterium]